MSDDEENNKTSASPKDATLLRAGSVLNAKAGSSATAFSRFRTLLVLKSFVASAFLLRYLRVISTLTLLQCLTFLPVFVTAYSGFLRRSATIEERILPLTLVVSVASAQLPLFVASFAACASIVLFSLATLPRGPRLHRARPRTSPLYVVLATVLLLVVLLTENFMVWVVSATFPAGQSPKTAPTPLQDNGRIVLDYLWQELSKREVVGLRRLWNVQWSLVACVGASFIVVDVFGHPRRQLYSVGVRAILTLAMARFLRTVSFLLTVLPSQVSQCYSQRYPNPPPKNWWDWIAVGLLPASHGGCNDLIISGHATVTTTLTCLSASVSRDPYFPLALWTLLVLDFAVEVYEGFHYSVDMWLGMILVSLIWRVLQPLEGPSMATTPATTAHPHHHHTSGNPTTLNLATRRDVLVYGFPAFVGYLQAAWLPQSVANAVIVLYVIMAAAVFYGYSQHRDNPALQQMYMHYSLHLLLCVMFIALATYL